MSRAELDVAIVGAGPYGLAAAAYLASSNGLSVQLFGQPMSFWEQQMPEGMRLRSPYVASSIADPERSLTLDDYRSSSRQELPLPLGLDRFVDYGHWFQNQAFPRIDPRLIGRIDAENGGFRLNFGQGDPVRATRVVVAAGIHPFVRRPEAFDGLPAELASHSSEHRSLSPFAGRRVVVVGGGQSALESAALLNEAGADVEVLVRRDRVYFLRRVPTLHQLGPVTRLLFAPAEVGPAGISRIVSAPDWYRRMPRSLQDRFRVRLVRPAGAAWLVDRLNGVPITVGRAVVSATASGDTVELGLDDGPRRTCDHVLLATGYRVDVAKYPFLPDRLLQRIGRVGGSPRLTRGFESSVPGLYFLGAPAVWSFGPLMGFVAGTEFAASSLARGISGNGRKH